MLYALAAILAQMELPKAWYGPVTATFEVQFQGNPYDDADNDIRVRFTDSKGLVTERLAFFDGGVYKAVFVADHPETYRAQLIRNGELQQAAPTTNPLVVTKTLGHGYIQRDPKFTNRFRYTDGTPYAPVGFNLGWGSEPKYIPDVLRKMGKAQVNWSRIWACNWDGKNPWWPSEKSRVLPRQLWSDALDQWQKIVDTADEVGVPFQMVLFHHGSFSSNTNPNWPEHPWNAKNGGFLKNAADFFTDPEAKHRAKMWLRYAVARYGASPNVLAWELFNEVEWVDARYQNRWKDITAWHKEMADYVRSIDPYHHLITTSSDAEHGIFEAVDYYQYHVYPADLTSAIFGTVFPKDKPGFFGECGPGDGTRTLPRTALRDGLYSGLLANHAGAGMYWSWDVLDPANLYDEFIKAQQILTISRWANHPDAKPTLPNVESRRDQTLTFAPGLGWAKSTRSEFHLPEDANPKALSEIASYFQGKNNASLSAGPLVFTFDAPAAGEMKITVSEIAQQGAKLVVVANGTPEEVHDYSPDSGNKSEVIAIPFRKGLNKISIRNDGQDWARITRFEVPGIGPAVRGVALEETGWMLTRLTAANAGEQVKITSPRVSGPVKVHLWDLDAGTMTESTPMADPTTWKISLTLPGKDVVVLIEK